MKRIILMLTVAALFVLALTVTAPLAFAKNGCEEPTFEKGVQTTTCTQGSHGTEATQHGKGGGGGEFIASGPCKQTGSTKTNTCG